MRHGDRMADTNPIVLAPGLLVTSLGVLLANLVHAQEDSVSPLVVAVGLGVVYTNLVGFFGLVGVSAAAQPGTMFAAKRLIRVGVVLLGLQLSSRELAKLGGGGLLIVAVTVAMTFFGTQWAGKRLGVSSGLSLLIATGYSICGASAIAAMKSVSGADDDEVAYSLALVTMCGSLAVAVLPGLGHLWACRMRRSATGSAPRSTTSARLWPLPPPMELLRSRPPSLSSSPA